MNIKVCFKQRWFNRAPPYHIYDFILLGFFYNKIIPNHNDFSIILLNFQITIEFTL